MSLAEQAHINELLDEALSQTFPASDSVAINIEPAASTSNSEQRREQKGSSHQGQVEASL